MERGLGKKCTFKKVLYIEKASSNGAVHTLHYRPVSIRTLLPLDNPALPNELMSTLARVSPVESEGVDVILVDGSGAHWSPRTVADAQLVSLMYQRHMQVTEMGDRNDTSSLNVYPIAVSNTVLSSLRFGTMHIEAKC